jgi:pimeloyl-ACP methyl ester carboxylesterase
VSIAGYPDPGIVQAINVPTLLIHGAMDAKIPVAGVQAACSSVSRCQLVAVAGAAHNMISPERETIITETARFLNRLVTGG